MKKMRICKVSFVALLLFCFSLLYSELRLETVSSYGEIYKATSHIAYPKSIEDLQLLIKEARLNSQKFQ